MITSDSHWALCAPLPVTDRSSRTLGDPICPIISYFLQLCHPHRPGISRLPPRLPTLGPGFAGPSPLCALLASTVSRFGCPPSHPPPPPLPQTLPAVGTRLAPAQTPPPPVLFFSLRYPPDQTSPLHPNCNFVVFTLPPCSVPTSYCDRVEYLFLFVYPFSAFVF